MQLIHGPVASKRFGQTLGVNLLGLQKVCSYDCVYCSLGPTQLTMNVVRKGFTFPGVEDLRRDFRAYIAQHPKPDAILVSGNGEPTLHPDFDPMMAALVTERDDVSRGTPIAVLTNGAHLDQKNVVAGLNRADERVIKIDAGNDRVLQALNQPLVRLNVSRFIGSFRKLSPFVVQSMFVGGDVHNAAPDMIDDWLEVIGLVKPQSVQLCTLDLPAPLYPGLTAVEEDTLYGVAFRLKKRTGIEAKVFLTPKT